ncbi:MAG: glycosyltransferase family 2 protein [Steroidobacteraceae bacterium]
MSTPEISVVVPVCNEETNVEPLAAEIGAALSGRAFELLFIDDGSTDGTAAAVLRARAQLPQIRLLQHARRSGQSAALCSGMRAARAEWVATLDGDGQNDPADIPNLIATRDAHSDVAVRLYMGHRQKRRDTWVRRISSRVANGVRGRMLRDSTPDTGCGIKLMHRPTFLELPRFDHMHRFLPALYQRAGTRVVSVPVNHRPRLTGSSKYGLFDRLWVGIVDLFGVMWLGRRHPPPLDVSEKS